MLIAASAASAGPMAPILSGLRMLLRNQSMSAPGEELLIHLRPHRWRALSSARLGWSGNWSSGEDQKIPMPVKQRTIRLTFFYPELTWTTAVIPRKYQTQVRFSEGEHVATLEIRPVAMRRDNVADSGARESLYTRVEQQVRLVFDALGVNTFTGLYDYWSTHAALGRQTELVLDRFDTCAGQWEYDQFNRSFASAELVQMEYTQRRTVLARALYTVELVFRQGIAP